MDHRDQEQQLRKEKLKHETNVEGLLGRYDEEMTIKQVIDRLFNTFCFY
jgi:hypothetical protein